MVSNLAAAYKKPDSDVEIAGCDAFITNIPGVGLLIQQADCQAVMLFDPRQQVVAKLLRVTVLQGESTPFVLELPPYRFPTLKGLFIHTWEKAMELPRLSEMVSSKSAGVYIKHHKV